MTRPFPVEQQRLIAPQNHQRIFRQFGCHPAAVFVDLVRIRRVHAFDEYVLGIDVCRLGCTRRDRCVHRRHPASTARSRRCMFQPGACRCTKERFDGDGSVLHRAAHRRAAHWPPTPRPSPWSEPAPQGRERTAARRRFSPRRQRRSRSPRGRGRRAPRRRGVPAAVQPRAARRSPRRAVRERFPDRVAAGGERVGAIQRSRPLARTRASSRPGAILPAAVRAPAAIQALTPRTKAVAIERASGA